MPISSGVSRRAMITAAASWTSCWSVCSLKAQANDVRIVRGFILSGSVRSAGPVLGRKFLVDVVREPPQLVLLGRQDGLIAPLRVAGCQQLLQVRLDPPSAPPHHRSEGQTCGN